MCEEEGDGDVTADGDGACCGCDIDVLVRGSEEAGGDDPLSVPSRTCACENHAVKLMRWERGGIDKKTELSSAIKRKIH